MINAPATQPSFPVQNEAALPAENAVASTNPRSRRPWSPDRQARLIYQQVKMQGHSQSWVANQWQVSQATVSRVIQSYERWQAHAKQREGGRLDRSERLRAQRWLTFERNELILASCLRIANEMEGFTEVSKSTITRPLGKPGQETQLRTEESALDRSGVAARFLRLAFRINAEQLRLAELNEPPPAEELSAEELAEEERLDAAADQELRESERLREEESAERLAETRRRQQEQVERNAEIQRLQEIEEAERQALADELEQRQQAEAAESDPAEDAVLYHPADDLPTTHHSSATPSELHNVHNLHSAAAEEINANPTEPCSCAPPPRSGKKSPTCITDKGEPQWPGNGKLKGAPHHRVKPAPK